MLKVRLKRKGFNMIKHERLIIIIAIICALFCLFMGMTAHAADVTLTWDANTEPDLAGYNVYTGTKSGVYGDPTDRWGVHTLFRPVGR